MTAVTVPARDHPKAPLNRIAAIPVFATANLLSKFSPQDKE